MTIRKLLLTLSIVLSCGLIVGGIVSAQEAPKAPEAPKSPKAEVADADFDFDFDFDFDDDEPSLRLDDQVFNFPQYRRRQRALAQRRQEALAMDLPMKA